MSKGSQSKFLTIYFSALGVGALALGYLGWSASSAADEAETKYKGRVAELDRLEKAPLSRTSGNAAKKTDLVKTYVDQVKALNTSMLAWQAPINEAESGEGFQKKLNEAVKSAKADGLTRQVKVPEKFDFGMDKYLAAFPESGTAPRLSAQLDSLIFVVNAAMESGVSSIDSMTRGELAFESVKSESGPATAATLTPAQKKEKAKLEAEAAKLKAKAPAGPTMDESKVFERQPLTLNVTGKNRSVLALLEALANTSPEQQSPHFFIVRALRVENALKDGPAKTQTVAVDEKEEAGPDGTKIVVKRDAMYLLGNEQVKMHLEIDLIRFVAETAPAEKDKPAAKTASAN